MTTEWKYEQGGVVSAVRRASAQPHGLTVSVVLVNICNSCCGAATESGALPSLPLPVDQVDFDNH